MQQLYNVAAVRDHGNVNHSGAIVRSTKGLEAQTWLQEFSKDSADKHAYAREFHLPRMFTKLDIFNQYFTRPSLSKDSMCYSGFQRMWVHDFPHVKCIKVRGCNYRLKSNIYEHQFQQADRNVGHCTVCSGLKHARHAHLARGEKCEAKEIETAMNLHNRHQMDERREDSRRKALVDINPKKYMHMYADGMDSKKSEVPWSVFEGNLVSNFTPQIPQSSEGCKSISDMDFKVQMSIFGVMTHNWQLDLYPWMHVVGSDSNVAITCILQSLER